MLTRNIKKSISIAPQEVKTQESGEETAPSVGSVSVSAAVVGGGTKHFGFAFVRPSVRPSVCRTTTNRNGTFL